MPCVDGREHDDARERDKYMHTHASYLCWDDDYQCQVRVSRWGNPRMTDLAELERLAKAAVSDRPHQIPNDSLADTRAIVETDPGRYVDGHPFPLSNRKVLELIDEILWLRKEVCRSDPQTTLKLIEALRWMTAGVSGEVNKHPSHLLGEFGLSDSEAE